MKILPFFLFLFFKNIYMNSQKKQTGDLFRKLPPNSLAPKENSVPDFCRIKRHFEWNAGRAK